MVSFRSPQKQAAKIMQKLQGSRLKSVGTARNYQACLTRVAEYIRDEKLPFSLIDISPEQAITYLEQRGQLVGQKTLDMERQALQVMMQSVSHQLAPEARLAVIKAELSQVLKARAYTPEQAELIAQHQKYHHAIGTRIAYAAGLRAHELFTLRPVKEQPADPRPALANKFLGRKDSIRYTVTGKGGLTREVSIPLDLAQQLEQTKLSEPRHINDRGIDYQSYYDIGGGRLWSNSFSATSKRVLGWSNGAHGLRHSYAQDRMDELQIKQHLLYQDALQIVSQEMGHFRPEITEVYLR